MFTKSDKCDIIFLLYMTRGDCMIKKEMIAMLLAGGQGSRLGVLTEKVAKPAVAFGGKYRIIDFPLSNCINSGIDTVGVLTQYQPLRLNTHIGIGIPWDLDRNVGGVTALILPLHSSSKLSKIQPLPVHTSNNRHPGIICFIVSSTRTSVSNRGISTLELTRNSYPINQAFPVRYCTGIRFARSRIISSYLFCTSGSILSVP